MYCLGINDQADENLRKSRRITFLKKISRSRKYPVSFYFLMMKIICGVIFTGTGEEKDVFHVYFKKPQVLHLQVKPFVATNSSEKVSPGYACERNVK